MKSPKKSSSEGADIVAQRQAEQRELDAFNASFGAALRRRGVAPRPKDAKSFGDYLDEGGGSPAAVVAFGIRKALDKQKDSP